MRIRLLVLSTVAAAALAFAGAAVAATPGGATWNGASAWSHAKPNPYFCEQLGLRPLRAAKTSMASWD